ncbi:protein of unknown function [Methylorubrum extorquens DM4]|uniref:Uncharacterized protein n=1 Tax=Methylorubrum extorquens (strain DSM 6343 / CIP 106787 / DM4) TaxID=661410 RepID=C7CE43_METED|nr:protein of unknown function [Methylorubrum extorquens DM4]
MRRDRVFAPDLYHPGREPGHRCHRERFVFTDTLGPHLTALSVGGVPAVDGGPWRIGSPAAETIEPEPSPPRVASE